MKIGKYDKILKWLLIVAGLFFLFSFFSVFRSDPDRDGWSDGDRPKIGLVTIRGVIYDSERFVQQIDKFARRKDIDAILVRIDSPGGTVAASQEIYEKIRAVRDSGRIPVIASMGTVAASGGVYIAMGADTIFANPGTATGSIGVILDFPVATGLLEKIGIEFEVIKSAALKDAGSPYREATVDDRAAFQKVIDDMHEQFVETVARERHLPIDEVRKLATGEIFTGRQALQLGLIDLLGGFEDAVALAGLLTGSDERPVVVRPARKRQPALWRLLFDDSYGDNISPQRIPQYRMR